MLNDLLLAVHILSAIAAAGATVTYFFWQSRSPGDPDTLISTLHTIRTMELRYVTPAYILVGLTGVVLTLTIYQEFNIPWAELALVVWIVLLGLVGLHSRTIRRQIAAIQDGGEDSPEFQSARSRGNLLRYLQLVAVVVLVYLMVFKPPLWG